MIKNKKILITGIGFLLIIMLVFVYMNFFKTYTVTFEAKIGPGVEAQEVKKGQTANKPADPKAEGFIFEGWYLDDQEYDFSTPVNKNIILTAKWQKTEK